LLLGKNIKQLNLLKKLNKKIRYLHIYLEIKH